MSTIPELKVGDHWQLAAEAITLRIRWFGLVMGYVLVNFVGRETNQLALNAILSLGAVYALLDTIWSFRGKVFLGHVPLLISLMEALFIGQLCYFDGGLDSPFRFYYFLSLLVCAIRYSPTVTYSTFGLHTLSLCALALQQGIGDSAHLMSFILMIVFVGWVTWASTSLAMLIKSASLRLSHLNERLQENQAMLEERIQLRTHELQESQALLVQQEKQAAFGLLAAGIAHEVGNPLAAISSIVQLLNRRQLDEYSQNRLQMIDDQLRRIQRTLGELVNFSRPANTNITWCDLRECIQIALDIAKYYKRKKGKTIETRFDDSLPKIREVTDQLVQVFLNLILNALDATEEGGKIIMTTTHNDDEIRVEIADDGHGIDPNNQQIIFQPYFTTKSTGTGLGLFVCQRLIEQMDQARLELVESSPNGTTFAVIFTQRTPKAIAPTNPQARIDNDVATNTDEVLRTGPCKPMKTIQTHE